MRDIVSPIDARAVRQAVAQAPRLRALEDSRVALLDIGKPQTRALLDFIEAVLQKLIVSVGRLEKETFARPAGSELIHALSAYDAVIEGVAD